LLLAAAITGYVLHSNPSLQKELFASIARNVPGTFGQQLTDAMQSTIDKRAGVGVIGLVGVLLTGLGWVGKLRQAVDAVAGLTRPKRNFVVGRLINLLVLAGLGLGLLVSLGLTIAGTAVTHQILHTLGASNVTGVSYLVAAAGIVLSLLGDMLVIWWMLVQLPRLDVAPAVAFRGVLMAAFGFEVLKLVGTYTVARSSHSPTLGPFASLLAVLIWIELVSRFLLYTVAWMATAADSLAPLADAEPVEEPLVAVSPTSAAWLVGLGAATGAAAVIAVTDRRRRAVCSHADSGRTQPR
jgi:membrane protein